MFLRGELEQQPSGGQADAGSSASGSSGTPSAPAWGANLALPAASAASLKAILDQEAAAAAVPSPRQLPQGSASKPPTPAAVRLTPGSGGGLHNPVQKQYVWSELQTACHGCLFASPPVVMPAMMISTFTPSCLPTGVKTRPALESPTAASGAGGGPLRLSLASFMQTSPMAVQRKDSASPPPAAWGGAAGSSPPGRHTSFRAIQEEQEASQPARPPPGTSPPAASRLGSGLPPWRPPAGVPSAVVGGAGGASLLGTSPSGSGSLFGTSPSARSTTFMAAPIPQHSKW